MVKKIKGTSIRPRLCIYRSNNHIYAQVIDDSTSRTLTSCSTLDKEVKEKITSTKNIFAASIVGELVGKRILEHNIYTVVFDRNGKLYHGRIKAVADGVRKAGLIL